MGPVAAWLELEEEEEGCRGLGCTARVSQTLCPTRHLLNVTWEHRDFSFNEGGYLVRPTMVVISLNQHRLWEMVGPPDPLEWARSGGGWEGWAWSHAQAGVPPWGSLSHAKPMTGTKSNHGGMVGLCSNVGQQRSARTLFFLVVVVSSLQFG